MDTDLMQQLLASMAGTKILVVGDVMLDRFLWGDATRINPEAPVPVLHVTNETYAPGGAANAASNVISLGGEVIVAGFAGDDAEAQTLVSLLEERGIQVKLHHFARRTITKTRAIARGQQLLRIDYEESGPLDEAMEAAFLEELSGLAADVDAVLVSDYGKGVVTGRLLESLTRSAGIVAVDPIPRHIDYYRNVTLITPNVKEAGEALFQEIHSEDDLQRVGTALTLKLCADVLITRGKDGMSLFRSGTPALHLPTLAREVIEVTGAGDTVIAAITLALAAGVAIDKAVELANRAAGIVVSKVGTATVTPEELLS